MSQSLLAVRLGLIMSYVTVTERNIIPGFKLYVVRVIIVSRYNFFYIANFDLDSSIQYSIANMTIYLSLAWD
jgi:hypothetical protein